jgi:hypothetical protein
MARGLSHLLPSLKFILFNADMVYPLCMAALAAVAALAFQRTRSSLRDRWALAAFLGVPVLWAALVPWSAMFLGAMDVRYASPKWAFWPILAVLFGWPLVAAALIIRTRGSRAVSALFVVLNIPGWLLGCFVSGMAISGDWI